MGHSGNSLSTCLSTSLNIFEMCSTQGTLNTRLNTGFEICGTCTWQSRNKLITGLINHMPDVGHTRNSVNTDMCKHPFKHSRNVWHSKNSLQFKGSFKHRSEHVRNVGHSRTYRSTRFDVGAKYPGCGLHKDPLKQQLKHILTHRIH